MYQEGEELVINFMLEKQEVENVNKYNKGFTVMEALVAFSILIIAFTAFVSSTTVSMKAFLKAEEYQFANLLAMEGLELVISKKDNHNTCVFFGDCVDWRTRLEAGNYEVSAFRVDELLPDKSFSSYSHASVHKPRDICFLDESDNEGIFGYCTGPPAGPLQRDATGKVIPGHFRREIVIENIGGGGGENDPAGILVKSIVRWGDTTNNPPHKVQFETFLYEKRDVF